MLNNLRSKFDPIFERIGGGFAKLGFGPNFWTWLGLVFSVISAFMFSLHSPAIGVGWYTATVLGGIFLLIAGFFDAIDGAVARATNKTSPLGGFLDSVIDKVSEIIIFIGIMVGNLTNPVLVLVTLSLSILISYTRARAEAMGIDLKGRGIAERAERILIIAILGFIPFRDNISVALWIISILAIVTVLERLKVVAASYGVSLFSAKTMSEMFSRDISQIETNRPSSSSKFNTQPPSSVDKITKNVKDFLESPDKKPTSKPSSSTSTTSSPSSQDKIKFLDKTDPNETGRNVAQIIFDQENEDKKMPKPTQTTTTTTTSKPSNKPTSDNKTAEGKTVEAAEAAALEAAVTDAASKEKQEAVDKKTDEDKKQ